MITTGEHVTWDSGRSTSRFAWFWYGVLAAELLNLLVTQSPDSAWRHLQAWLP